jgi:ABC-2 type transport system ATP-binding protein
VPTIELRDVTKRFGDFTALHGLDLEVEDGEIYGFLGPNGAGKSTTINILLDFVRPTSGAVEVFGMDAHAQSLEIRRRTGVLPEGYEVYDRLTARQHVEFAIEAKEAYQHPMQLLERVGLEDAADRKAGGFSKGMQQRLAFAIALIGEPDLLILDEPSSGLDPNGAREMRDIIREENERGATVFFSSHILEQVEAVCDRVGILREGKLVAEDSIEELRATVESGTTLEITVDEATDMAVASVQVLEDVADVEVWGDTITVTTHGPNTAVLDALREADVEVRDFTTVETSLEDLFSAYTQDQDHDGDQTGDDARLEREA